MKKLILATSIAFCLATGAAQNALASNKPQQPETKQSEKTNEMIGFGSGALAGGAVAGPLGAIIGGIFGIMIADDVNGDKQLKQANQALAQADHRATMQEQSVSALQTEIGAMQQQQMIQLAAFDEQSSHQDSQQWLHDLTHFETNLQFKTASFLIADIYLEQLNSLASLLISYPQLSVKLTGFADQRGDSQFNKELSEQRAAAVKHYLVNNKVNSNQIHATGMGETNINTLTLIGNTENNADKSNQSNIEDLFFARKVKVNLLKSSEHMTAAN